MTTYYIVIQLCEKLNISIADALGVTFEQSFKATGHLKDKDSITIKGSYEFSWGPVYNNSRYYVIEV
ncbi:hypothetical protein LL033_08150 [Clostridium estertheticum]|uniref:hypothetical protein n=1 Tax=Clostridium estertheticum TaxID=238834 RepID=UPI001C0B91ED|nr:hypothetical protein [Clostridium estertheticum]MBU3214781.1 hypothetical protein [Clostridium estertheticum]WAG57193.1 hypothetical protein LL033_08150 [Clostridium estertheticum]